MRCQSSESTIRTDIRWQEIKDGELWSHRQKFLVLTRGSRIFGGLLIFSLLSARCDCVILVLRSLKNKNSKNRKKKKNPTWAWPIPESTSLGFICFDFCWALSFSMFLEPLRGFWNSKIWEKANEFSENAENRLVASKKYKRYILRVNVAQMINWVHENSSFLSALKTRFFCFNFSRKMGKSKEQTKKAKDAVDKLLRKTDTRMQETFWGHIWTF